jgi:hypothetical protein
MWSITATTTMTTVDIGCAGRRGGGCGTVSTGCGGGPVARTKEPGKAPRYYSIIWAKVKRCIVYGTERFIYVCAPRTEY